MLDELKAVLIDDDVKRHEILEQTWSNILNNVFPKINLEIFNDITRVTNSLINRPHIIIVDNVFETNGVEKSNIGVDFIKEQKKNHKDSLFILCTGATFQVDALGNRFPNPDFIVTKTSLLNKGYQSYIAIRIAELLSRLPCGDVVFKNAKEHFKQKENYPHIVSILEQCTKVFHTKISMRNDFRIELTTLSGGYSGSSVYQAIIVTPGLYNTVPFVFKIGSKSNINREIDNYNANVRLNMTHDMRVDLIDTGETDNFSGVLYSFAFGNACGISSATDLIKDKGEKSIEMIISSLFLSDTGGWYTEPKGRLSVLEFYSNSEEYGQNKDVRRLNGLEKNLAKILKKKDYSLNDEKFRVLEYKFDHIRRLIQKFDQEIVITALCHGDLNTNNIFFSKDIESMALIDFEYSSQDMIFKDFISLETSIRAYAIDSGHSLEELVKMEIEMMTNEKFECANNCPSFILINQVRQSSIQLSTKLNLQTVFKNFDHEALYHVGLLFHVFKLLGLNIWDEKQIHRLLACFLATAFLLENKD